MATPQTPLVPLGDGADADDAAVQRPWRMARRMSSLAEAAESFLATAGFDRGPWLVVAFAGGIAAWFVLGTPWQWSAAIGLALLLAVAAMAAWPQARDGGGAARALVRQACVALGLMFAAGVATVWLRSAVVGAEPIAYPRAEILQGYVLEREEQPAEGRVRLTLATRDAEAGAARKVRVNVPLENATARMDEGAVVRLRARLMPPALAQGRSRLP
ncbi:MAG: DUF4131 domain-containing protein [Erythrobacter sp.]